ncbi:MAG: hypothetical protein WA901_19530 [Phormidesmis sp.]
MTLLTIRSTASWAASLPTATGDNNSAPAISLSNIFLAEEAFALIQNETVESNSSQRFGTLN